MDKVNANVQQHNHHALATHQLPSAFTIKTPSIDLKEETGDGPRYGPSLPRLVFVLQAYRKQTKKTPSGPYHLLGWLHYQNMELTADRASKSRAIRLKTLLSIKEQAKLLKLIH